MTNQPAQLKRAIPSTGELLPAVGLGTYNVFDVPPTDDGPLQEVLKRFVDSGGKVVDSSPMYGNAETVTGDLAAKLGVRAELFLATKVWITGKASGIRQMEASFKRMHTGMIDLIQVHNLVDWETHFETLTAWKEKGKIRYTGITHYSTTSLNTMERVMQIAHPDFIQIYYSIHTREAENRLLPMAADLGIGVIVNRPFETAGLFSRLRGKRLPAWAHEFGCTSWAQFFLKFIISHPAVTCAIPATGNPAHLLDNMQAGSGLLPDHHMREKMAQYVETL